VPVPRRFDRRPPDRDLTRINDRIRVPEVRLVGEDGKQIGVIKTADALVYAQERDLDLVEVAPDARPPVCRVLDYSKYKYEQAQKLKAARKHQQQITIREIKFRPKIALNDYETKKGHVRRFLLGKDRVKVTIMFRGREVTHPERGTALLSRLAEELADVGVVEQTPIQDGRNMTMMLAPSKSVLAAAENAAAEKAAEAAASDRQQTAPATEKDGAKAVSPAAESASDGQPDGASADQDRAEAPEPPEAPEAVPAAAKTPEAVSAAATGGGDGQQNGAADTVSPTPSDAPA
jgi:translation initiation factor IF-3